MGVKSRADRSSVLVDTLHRGTDELKLTGHGGGPRDARASEHRERHRPAMRGAQQIDQPLRVVACRAPGIDRGAGSCVLSPSAVSPPVGAPAAEATKGSRGARVVEARDGLTSRRAVISPTPSAIS